MKNLRHTFRAKSKIIAGLMLFLFALVSSLVIEGLHGHACTGDGCMLCFVITCAYALLALSLIATLACPIARIVSRLRITCRTFELYRELSVSVADRIRPERAAMTPVAMGVRLLI